MAQTAKQLVDALLLRVRDSQGLGTTRAQVLSVLSDVQQLVNANGRYMLEDIVMTTEAYCVVYPVQSATTLGAPLAVVSVRDSAGRQVVRSDFSSFVRVAGPNWLRQTGDAIEGWAQLGKDLLVLWPSLEEASTVTVTIVKKVTLLLSELTESDFNDAEIQAVLDMSELLVLLRKRELDSFKGKLQMVSGAGS